MADLVAPPGYEERQHQDNDETTGDLSLQILITPPHGATAFQVGYLGAQDDHASIEGEVQIKGGANTTWDRVIIALSTTESVESRTIELAKSEALLFSSPSQSTSSRSTAELPSSLPFSIPLTPDLPQSVVTPTSSVSHSLTVTLYSRSTDPVVKSVPVQISRYTSASASSSNLSIDPVNASLEAPIQIHVQTPRAVYRVGEPIPVYVTIPPPDRSSIESGLRLRNVKAELVRETRIGDPDVPSSAVSEYGETSNPLESTSTAYPPEKSLSPFGGTSHSSVLTRSGASARFHSTRTLKLRLVLHDGDGESAESGNITQTTLLHHTSFHLHVLVSFTSSVSQSATTASVSIPLVLLPPLAPTPEGDVNEEIDAAYHKKHDPPPTRTARMDDLGEGSSRPPAFDEFPGQTGGILSPSSTRGQLPPTPSFSEASASTQPFNSSFSEPPLFADNLGRDPTLGADTSTTTPLPPSFDEVGVTGGSHLPSFNESESEARAAASVTQSQFGYWFLDPSTDQQELRFEGEGEIFGFTPSDQYDGISHSLLQSAAPAVNNNGSLATGIRNSVPRPLTELSDSNVIAQIIDAVAGDSGLGSLRIHNDGLESSPPPPPAMDDPSDPPPAIDEGVYALSEEERDRRERAIVEAAAAVGAGRNVVVSGDGVTLGLSASVSDNAVVPSSDGGGVGGAVVAPSVHGAREEAIDARGPVGTGQSGGESRPPPYLGVSPTPAPGSHGPPPYVDL